MSRPDIFDYSDYKLFLADWFEHKKQEREAAGLPPYSHRMFAQDAGVPNVGILVSVISGKKHLTEALQSSFRRPLGLDDDEAAFLRLLAAREKAAHEHQKALKRQEEALRDASASDADKRARRAAESMDGTVETARATVDDLERQITGSRRMRRAEQANQERARLLASWTTVAIAELVNCVDFRLDPDWISQKLYGRISPEDVATTLALMKELGALKTGPDGRPVYDGEVVLVGDSDKPNVHLIGAYYAGIQVESGRAMRRSFEDAEFASRSRLGGLTIAVSSSKLPEIRAGVMAIRKQLFAFFEGLGGEPDMVYQVWLQTFPLSEPTTDGTG